MKTISKTYECVFFYDAEEYERDYFNTEKEVAAFISEINSHYSVTLKRDSSMDQYNEYGELQGYGYSAKSPETWFEVWF